MPQPDPRTASRLPAAAAGGAALALVVLACAAAVADDRSGSACLAALGPLVGAAARVGELLLLEPARLVAGAAAAAAGVLLAAALAARGRGAAGSAAGLAAAASAVAGQGALVAGAPILGLTGHTTAFALLLLARLGEGGAALPFDPGPARPRISWREAAALAAILAVAAVFRFYALNRVVASFEGELAPFMVGATNLPGALLANAGAGGPWAPLGLLYYLPIRLGVALAGPTVLAVRLGSAVVAMLTVAAGFLLAREVAGRTAGLAAAAMLALDPLQIGWGRSDVHPHGATAWVGLLLGVTTLRMLATGKAGWAAATAFLMALSWHQYPSGQLAVLVPLAVVAGRALADHRGVLRLGWRLLALPAGALLWWLGFPASELAAGGRWASPAEYLARLGPRVEGGEGAVSAGGYLATLASHLADLVEGVFVRVPDLFHQTFLPEVAGLGQRSLPWAVAALALVGATILALRPLRPPSLVVLALLAVGAAPSVFSNVAYVKRAAALYPAAAVAAAVACAAVAGSLRAAGLRRALAAAAAAAWVGWACLAAVLWFSGRWYPWGRPPEEVAAEAVAAEVRPHTLVLAGFRDFYMEGKLTYLLSGVLTRPGLQPVVWVVRHENQWRGAPPDPAEAVRELAASPPWTVRWSPMRDTLAPALASGEWRRAVVVAERSPDLERWLDRLCGRWPVVRDSRLDTGEEPKHRMRLVVLDLEGGPLRPPRE